jgi:hypothetical protein
MTGANQFLHPNVGERREFCQRKSGRKEKAGMGLRALPNVVGGKMRGAWVS